MTPKREKSSQKGFRKIKPSLYPFILSGIEGKVCGNG